MATATPSKFTRIRSVTLPVLKIEPGKDARFIYVVGPMTLGKKIDDQKEPATIMHSIDMDTGEEGVVICSTVLKNELNTNYPGESYIGKGFEVSMTRDREKKYNHCSIAEVAVPDELLGALKAKADAVAKATAATAGKAKAK